MGLFDRLKSIAATAVSVDMRGPLQLSLADGVAYYRERFVVSGVRRLDARGNLTWHYCLSDEQGARAVLVAEEGAELTLAMHRHSASELPWDRDVIEGVAGSPLKLAANGHASVVTVGDTGGAATRSVSFRIYCDAAGERFAALEDWGGRRESRVGETILEAELEFTRSEAEAAAAAEAEWYDGRHDGVTKPSGAQRGTAAAAARVLESAMDKAKYVAETVPLEDRDPTAYADDAWDEETEARPVERPASTFLPVFDSEEDEWRAAAKHLREHGVPAERA